MKFNTRVRIDIHGLYLKTDGQIFRPQPTVHSVLGMDWKPSDPILIFHAGQHVNAKHVNQTPDAKVTNERGISTYWHSHGTYCSVGKDKDSEECWNPAPFKYSD